MKKLKENAVVPKRATDGSAGADLYACIDQPIELCPGQLVKIPTGIAIELADKGLAAFLFARSGLGVKHGITLSNSVGVVDSDYRGEICVILENTSPESYKGESELLLTDKGNKKGPYHVKKGDRIAQMVVAKYEKAEFAMTESVETIGINREGGFGSTGV